MENDRAQVNVGDAVNAEFGVEKQEPPKQPRRRFVGRKTAAVNAQKIAEANSHIEDGAAVQRQFSVYYITQNPLIDKV